MNAPELARVAEDIGVKLVTVHGRTRACGFRGQAEFETVAEVKAGVRVPVIANGDIGTPEDAARVLALTGDMVVASLSDRIGVATTATGSYRVWMIGK